MSTFRLVAGLWVTLEIDATVSNGAAPPFVDHNQIDYGALTELVHEELLGGGAAAVRFANDTVDQVTVQLRMQGPAPQTAECLDFGTCLLGLSDLLGNPIDVRSAWRPLHFHVDRTQAPPPSLLIFVIEGDFEEVMIGFNKACQRLNMRSADLGVMLAGTVTAPDQMGVLPLGVQAALASQFGINFRRHCHLARLAHSPLPGWASGQTLM